ncbi:MAG: hypothetical protein ACRDCG_02990 [Mycoplasmoidaceae bacterium]
MDKNKKKKINELLNENEWVRNIKNILIFQWILMVISIILILLRSENKTIWISTYILISLWMLFRLITIIMISSKNSIIKNINENLNINLFSLILFSEITSIVFIINSKQKIREALKSCCTSEWEEYSNKFEYFSIENFINDVLKDENL